MMIFDDNFDSMIHRLGGSIEDMAADIKECLNEAHDALTPIQRAYYEFLRDNGTHMIDALYEAQQIENDKS